MQENSETILEKVQNIEHYYNNIDKELIIVDVWFGRDADGTSCTFDGKSPSPARTHKDGKFYMWESRENCICYTEHTCDTMAAYGKGFFGVRKGTYKLLKLIAVKKGIDVLWLKKY